jgi:hypothetical protein
VAGDVVCYRAEQLVGAEIDFERAERARRNLGKIDRAFGKPTLTAPAIFDNLLKVLARKTPSRPTLFGFFLNRPLYAKLAGRRVPDESGHSADYVWWLISAFGNAGYDYTTHCDFHRGYPETRAFIRLLETSYDPAC